MYVIFPPAEVIAPAWTAARQRALSSVYVNVPQIELPLLIDVLEQVHELVLHSEAFVAFVGHAGRAVVGFAVNVRVVAGLTGLAP